MNKHSKAGSAPKKSYNFQNPDTHKKAMENSAKARKNTTVCSEEDCDRLSRAKGLCSRHYEQSRRNRL